MTTDSPPTPRLPPARSRARPAASVSAASAAALADASGDEPDDITPTPSLIGDGPGQYLLGCENRQSFDEMKAAFDRELRPADPIERMWVDEIVDLEWDLHRLRTTRRRMVEDALTDQLANRVFRCNAAVALMAQQENPEEIPPELPRLVDIQYEARACVRGDPEGRAYITEGLGTLRLEDELQIAHGETFGILARLEPSIHASSRLRDSILTRLYGRRDAMAGGRITSGHTR